MPAETGRGSTRPQPDSSTARRTVSSGGSIAIRKQVWGLRFGTSRKFRKLTCFDQRYVAPSNSIFLPLFSHVAMVLKHGGAPSPNGHNSRSTGGRVGRHGTP